ncbi:hypothetical protein [Devosia sp.]|uniref:hypothetical protein n=1 Tax=Devosia sp. TaxID=1871048 RepID=UPI001AD535B5|nr:hypothetical protein [Devosia sp.]MBN9334960.1 hypothetical protein [Devosia sp.]
MKREDRYEMIFQLEATLERMEREFPEAGDRQILTTGLVYFAHRMRQRLGAAAVAESLIAMTEDAISKGVEEVAEALRTLN